MAFTVPQYGLRFYRDVLDRSQDLIHVGIWAGLHPTRLKTWLKNFSTDAEKYFAACLLDSLIFRSSDQVVALTMQVFERAIPDIVRLSPAPLGHIDDWLVLLCSNQDPLIRVVPVLQPSDPPGKSGDIVARLLKRGLQVNRKLIIEPVDVPRAVAAGVQTFIFIDDFLGTGHQFKRMVRAASLTDIIRNTYCMYTPLASHVTGKQYLQDLYPNLHLGAGEDLYEAHSVFDSNSLAFKDGTNSLDDVMRFYEDLLQSRDIIPHPIIQISGGPVGILPNNNPKYLPRQYRLGYGKMALAYAFDHAIPNNSLPLFWWAESANWTPLLSR
jgi:hypothetical protein